MKPSLRKRANNRLQLIAAGLALTIAMLVMVSFEYAKERRLLLATLEAQARIVGESSIPALVFDDPAAARTNLASLASIAMIRGAAIYRLEDPQRVPVLFADYVTEGLDKPFPATELPGAGLSFLTINLPISVEDAVIGYVHIASSPTELLARIARYLAMVAIVASLALALAYALTGRLRRRVVETERVLERRAYFDELTELPNRSFLTEQIAEAVAHARRQDQPFALLFCDLDNFKVVNDSLGHAAGDLLLGLAARRLRGAVRVRDTVGRLGGDEFIALLENVDDVAAAQAAGHVITALSEPYALQGQELSLGTSVGIAMYPRDGADAGGLLRAADTALYAAKSAGRGVYQFFSPALERQAHERMALESGLRRALAQQQLSVHYQAQVDVGSGTVIGAEALVRWNSPEFGQVPPSRFIPIAEESGLIGDIGAWVLDEACRQAHEWIKRIPAFVIAVNLSARQLNDPMLAERVGACLSRHMLEPEQLELEITESALLTSTSVVHDNLRALDTLGVHLSLDDFGTGYSSLGYLKRLPISRLKIDQGFVRHLPEDADDAAIVEAIIALAGALDMSAVAEGVETEAQFEFLRDTGCRFAQGWLFGKALPPDEFAAHHLD